MSCYAAQEDTAFFLIKVIIEFKIKTTANVHRLKEIIKIKMGRQEEIRFWKNTSLSFV